MELNNKDVEERGYNKKRLFKTLNHANFVELFFF